MKQKILRQSLGILVPITCVLALSACDSEEKKTESETPAVTANFSSLYTHVFSGCTAGGNCHTSTTNPENGPDFATTEASAFYDLIVGIEASAYDWDVASGCENELLINQSDASSSLIAGVLIESIANEYPEGCVPNYSAHVDLFRVLDATTSEALITWINNGASNN